MEMFKDTYQFYFLLKNSVITVAVKDNIIAEHDNKMHQYVLDFYNNERIFNTSEDFEKFFEEIISPIRERAESIIAVYNEEEYICEVEVSSIDDDRQMGTEVIYEIKFYDPQSEDYIVAAEVSEYPYGSFSIYDKNSQVEIDDEAILLYFHKQQNDNDIEDRPDNSDFDASDIDLDLDPD
jgi:hypothetical protein